MRITCCAQILAELLHIGCDGSVRDPQNLRNASVIQLDLVNLRVRITLRKLEDVLEVRSAPRVDRLRVVAHDHDVLMLFRQRIDQIRLDLVRILILVDEDKFELPPIKPRDLFVLKDHAQCFFEQIVEVQ